MRRDIKRSNNSGYERTIDEYQVLIKGFLLGGTVLRVYTLRGLLLADEELPRTSGRTSYGGASGRVSYGGR
ncbi:hypothetical protein A3L08_05010 [Thermococcus pacificus]|uniref:Uncharacterized protein n=1 Tax=Thermococcus pacificus TaxID=71998 RepID=A0A218P7H9_9EURY|nr:hypothetical protein A3L08_05010 [Thermococcus pacificus]